MFGRESNTSWENSADTAATFVASDNSRDKRMSTVDYQSKIQNLLRWVGENIYIELHLGKRLKKLCIHKLDHMQEGQGFTWNELDLYVFTHKNGDLVKFVSDRHNPVKLTETAPDWLKKEVLEQ